MVRQCVLCKRKEYHHGVLLYVIAHMSMVTVEENQVTTVGTIQGSRKVVGVIKEVANRDDNSTKVFGEKKVI